MRWIPLSMLLLGLAVQAPAAEPPLVEKYLHSGELARGEQALESALAESHEDDQLRLSLGILQVVRGVERVGQALYEHGCHSEAVNTPILRLPVPENPDPAPITYQATRRVLDGFRNDLALAERTLAKITDDDVKLRLRLADIYLDLTGDGKPDTKLSDILRKLMGPRFALPQDNPEFLVSIDRGDVAWLRAYCHLLMGIVEVQSGLDLEAQFERTADQMFPKPKFRRSADEIAKDLEDRAAWSAIAIKDPARLGRFRKHLLAVCELNHETWRYIRSERDNDHEWLPSAKQQGVLGLPVSDAMIDAWLGMIDEFQGLLNGKKIIGSQLVDLIYPGKEQGKGFSVKEFLDNPPDKIDWDKVSKEGIDPKYLTSTGQSVDISKVFRVSQVFQNSLAVGYVAWFN